MAKVSNTPQVASLAALTALKSAINGDSVLVATLLRPFQLDLSSAAVVDGINTVATWNGIGRWLGVPTPVPHWTNQLLWDVDSTGSVEASGIRGAGAPVPLAEFCRRVRRGRGQTFELNALGPITAADVYAPQIDVDSPRATTPPPPPTLTPAPPPTKVQITGTRTTMASGTFTATTATVGNAQATVTDVTVTWASFIGRHIVATSGPIGTIGAEAVVLEDLGAGAAEVSEWGFPSNGVTSATPGPGVTFKIVSNSLFGSSFRVNPQTVAGVQTELRNLETTTTDGGLAFGGLMTFRGCSHTSAMGVLGNFGDINFVGSAWRYAVLKSAFVAPTTAVALLLGGSVFARHQVTNGGLMRVSNFVSNRGCFRIAVAPFFNTGGRIANPTGTKWGIHRGPATEPALSVRGDVQVSIGGKFYGAGNAVLTDVREGGAVFIGSAVTPTATGTTELILEGSGTALPGLEASAGAVLPALAALTSWAQWAAAPFSRNAMNYTKGSKIISMVATP